MAHKIFLLHGMGKHDANWADPYITELKKLWASYPDLANNYPIADYEFIALRYDDVFERYRKKLGTHNDALIAKIDGQGKIPGAELIKFTSKLTGNAFVATHILDVALFYSFSTFKEAVATHLVDHINGHFKADEARDFSVIAHSLGTAVIQQSLQAWADNQQGKPWPVEFQIRVLLQASNVSRILEIGGHHDVYESVVRPATYREDGVCQYYLNARNHLDPIWWPKEFDPLDEWKASLSDTKRYTSCDFKHLASRNPHELMDYLKHPAVHIPLFRRLAATNAISDEQSEARFKQFTTSMSAELKQLAADYAALKVDDSILSFFDLMTKVDVLVAKP